MGKRPVTGDLDFRHRSRLLDLGVLKPLTEILSRCIGTDDCRSASIQTHDILVVKGYDRIQGGMCGRRIRPGNAPGGHIVRKFSAEGELLMTIGESGVAGDNPGFFREPTDVVVSPQGTIFVTEGHLKNGPHSRLTKLAADGSFIARFGSTGQGHLQLSASHSIAMDTEGRLFIADRDNNRIMIWDQDGNYIDQWTQFGRPSGGPDPPLEADACRAYNRVGMLAALPTADLRS